mmetsp:Transcript_7384/g.20681  ORF Transcript_7384/g.20681 Transcript_7384/m.20681 type:complete len:141 (+) Transcript_7384:64-486(+)
MAAANSPVVDIKTEVALRLEASGAMDQLRTRVRASVCRALLGTEGAEDVSRRAPVQPLSVVADFLQRLGLEHTREVFLRESSEAPLDRDELAQGLAGSADPSDEGAVLEQLVVAAKRRAGLQEEGHPSAGVPPTVPEVPA